MTATASNPLNWRKSSYSGNNGGDCLEIAEGCASVIPVRDSKNPSPTLTVPADAWQAFVRHVKG